MLSLLALRHQLSFPWVFASVPLVATPAHRFRWYRISESRQWRLRRFYDRALRRVQGIWAGNGARGEEFANPDHVYSEDLNLFGEGSLFELLSTARTAIGRRSLADYLLNAPAVEETLLRQQAVLELREQIELRERLAVLGKFELSESKWEPIAEWLDLRAISISSRLRIVAFGSSILIVVALLAGMMSLVPWIRAAIWIAPLVAFHSVIGLLFRNRINQMIASLQPVSVDIPWGEFEALNAFANYAYENSGHVFPRVSSEDAHFEAKALGHPLLSEAACIRNDIHLGGKARFYIVSGSNMSGKSTLLRAIGQNAVLALAGAPVRARALRLSRLSVCASLSVVDSLLDGKSKFMAEVDRLRQTIEAAAAGDPVLFLIDEIFSGTNSRARRVAAEAVVRTLVDRGSIGALSTHDLALTEIATSELGGVNVHTGARPGSNAMDFDYRLKPGVTTEANALAIARMVGIRV